MRDYDPATGRFVTVDPVFDPADSQQMNGYTYSNNNPVTFSDPSGAFCDSCDFYGNSNIRLWLFLVHRRRLPQTKGSDACRSGLRRRYDKESDLP